MAGFAAAYPLITTAAASAAGGLAVSALTSGGKSGGAAAPSVTPVTPMPDQKAIAEAAKRQSIMEQRRRQGRASTILTDTVVDTGAGETMGA